jgi:hypothetical protein
MSIFGTTLLLGASDSAPAPTFIGSNTTFNTSGSNLTLTTPTGTQNGDYMIAAIATAPAASSHTATGWSNLGVNFSSAPGLRLWKRLLTSAPSANYTFSWTGGGYNAGIIATFRDADDGNINNNGTYTNSSGSAADCGSIITAVANTMVICVAAVGHGNNGPLAPTGFTQIARLGSGGTDSGVGVGMHYKVFGSTGSTGTITTGGAGVADVYVGGLRSVVFA